MRRMPPPSGMALLPHLYASVLAHACNFGPEQMASLTDLAYDHQRGARPGTWREDTLKAADRAGQLSPYLPLSHPGGGILSSLKTVSRLG